MLSPLLFIMVLEALSQEFRGGVPWENLYADELVIITESLEEFVQRLLIWKSELERKGLRVDAGKTKVMICGPGLDKLQSYGSYPCGVCLDGVGVNSILCSGCKHWIHHRCSGLAKIKEDPHYTCKRCRGEARPIDGRPQKTVTVSSDVLDVVASFCYLGDMESAAGGCSTASVTRVKAGWNKFNKLLPILTTRHLTLKTRGTIYHACVRRVMLHGSETWPMTQKDQLRLQRNDRAMIRHICGIRYDQVRTTPSRSLLVMLGIADITNVTREDRLWWYGHVQWVNHASE